mgnify:CR=1 FL=1
MAGPLSLGINTHTKALASVRIFSSISPETGPLHSLAEESHLSLHELKAAALSNMYAGAQDVQINDYGMIKVNGVDVLNMNIEAVIDKLNITYINNYISPAWGSIQVLSFCLSEDLESSKPLLNDINSGIQINK